MNMISGDQDFGWADHSVLAAINADSPIPFFQSAQEAWVEDIVLSIFFSKALDDEEYRLFMDVFNEWILSGQRGTFGNRTFRGIFVQLPEPQVYRVSVAVGRRIDIVGALLTLARSLSDTPAIEVTRIVVGDDLECPPFSGQWRKSTPPRLVLEPPRTQRAVDTPGLNAIVLYCRPPQ